STGDQVAVGRAVTPVAAGALSDPDGRVRRLAAETVEETANNLASLYPETRTDEQIGTPEELRKQVADERAERQPLMNAFKEQAPRLAQAMADSAVHVRRRLNRAAEELGVARIRMLRRAAMVAEPEARAEAARPGKVAEVKLEDDPLLDALRI